MNWAWWLVRLVLGGAFAWAAVGKLLDPAAFAVAIDRYRLLPYPAALALAVYLPWLELAGAAAVLLRQWERGGQLLLIGLCVLFSVALASAAARGLDITCGCFGSGGSPIALALLRSGGLGTLAFALWRWSGEREIKL